MTAQRSKVDDIVAGEVAQLEISKGTDLGAATPDPTNDMRATPDAPCTACKQRHKGLGARFACLEASYILKRDEAAKLNVQLTAFQRSAALQDAKIAGLEAELAPWRKVRDGVSELEKQLGPSWVKKLRQATKPGGG